MGEVNTAPEVAAKAVEDLTAMEVDPDKGERLFKAAIIQSNKGATYRMLSKSLKTGKAAQVVSRIKHMSFPQPAKTANPSKGSEPNESACGAQSWGFGTTR